MLNRSTETSRLGKEFSSECKPLPLWDWVSLPTNGVAELTHIHCRLNLQPDNRPVLGTPQTSPNSRDFSWGPSSPIPTPTPNTRAGLDAGDPGKEEPRPPPQSHTAAGSPLYPNSQPQGHLGAAVPPRVSQPALDPRTNPFSLPPTLLGLLSAILSGWEGERRSQGSQVPGWLLGYSRHYLKENPHC